MALQARPELVPATSKGQAECDTAQTPRFAHRKQAASAAIIYSDKLAAAVPCVVRDMSATGARLRLTGLQPSVTHEPARLPAHFTLHIRLDRVAVECALVWRKKDEAGVRFTAPPRVLARSLR